VNPIVSVFSSLILESVASGFLFVVSYPPSTTLLGGLGGSYGAGVGLSDPTPAPRSPNSLVLAAFCLWA